MRKKYDIKNLSNVGDLVDYRLILEHDLVDVLPLILPPEGENVISIFDDDGNEEIIADRLVASLLGISLIYGSHEIALSLLPRCCREMESMLKGSDLANEEFPHYIDLFESEIFKSVDAMIYEVFFSCMKRIRIRYRGTLKKGCYSIASALIYGDYSAYETLRKYVNIPDIDTVDLIALSDAVEDIDFTNWLTESGQVSEDRVKESRFHKHHQFLQRQSQEVRDYMAGSLEYKLAKLYKNVYPVD